MSRIANTYTMVALCGVAILGLIAQTAADTAVAEEGAAAVSVGLSHACVLTTAGGVKCWGNNLHGQLGNGNTTDSLIPIDVAGLTEGVSKIAAGSLHSCALLSSGGVKCWGFNGDGRLGNGTLINSSVPVDVVGLSSGVSAIAAGVNYSCAIASGGLKCWGTNSQGELGNGTSTNSSVPVDVTGLSSGITSVAAGISHTCALTTLGAVKCWGANMYGQIGNGSTTASFTPVDVTGLTSGVAAISIGSSYSNYGDFSCALTTGGGVKCWGRNNLGQLGDTTTTTRTTPVNVSTLTSGVSAISVGSAHVCAITSAGGLKCWGYNNSGQLGKGTTTNGTTPADVNGLTSGVSVISAGSGEFTCAIVSTGLAVMCWGKNDYGQLGRGAKTDSSIPVNVTGMGSGVSAVSAGTHSCAVTSTGGAKCWGAGSSGQLGNGSTTASYTGVDVTGLTTGVAMVSAGDQSSCAITSTGGAKCWGSNYFRQLGDGTTTQRTSPVNVSGLTSGVSSVVTGTKHTCAITTAGGVKCWGNNGAGQVGDGTTTQRSTPVNVSGLTGGVSAVSVSEVHTCALTTGGGVKCWGYNAEGELGDGTTTNSNTPVDVTGLSSGVLAISAKSYRHSCALTTGGGVKCWGYNTYGQLGNSGSDSSTPRDVSGLTSGAIAIAVGYESSCALMSTGGVKCWGRNNYGQLGDGKTVNSSSPVDVIGLNTGVVGISVGTTHACAITSGGGVKCWGGNDSGQLGNRYEETIPANVAARTISGNVTTTGNPLVGVTMDGGEWGLRTTNPSGHYSYIFSPSGSYKIRPVKYGYSFTPAEVTGNTSTNATYDFTATVLPTHTISGQVRFDGSPLSGVTVTGSGDIGVTITDASGNFSFEGVPQGLGYIIKLSKPGYAFSPSTIGGVVNGNAAHSFTAKTRLGPTEIASGSSFSCVLTSSGGVMCWGYNQNGRLGDGSNTNSANPVSVVGLTSGVSAISVGSAHACAVTEAGGVKCWGNNGNGQLGNSSTTDSYIPVNVTGLGSGVTSVSAGYYHTCAVLSSGGVKCWGLNGAGQLGNGTTSTASAPVNVNSLSYGVWSIVAGYNYTCALIIDGSVKCWGGNNSGQLGDGTNTNSLTPVDVNGLGSNIIALSAGQYSACALVSSGSVRCWGSNSSGQIGDSTRNNSSVPVDVTGLTPDVTAITSGAMHSCAILGNGGLNCWGGN